MLEQQEKEEESYMFNFNQATIYSILCAVVPCSVYMIARRRKQGKIHNLWALLFVLYLWQIYDVTGIGTLSDITYIPDGSIDTSFIKGTINFIPFTHIDIKFILNIVMCIPFGFLIPLIWKEYRGVHKTVLLGAGYSLLIELSQLITTRASDINDLIANTCGAALGYMAWKVFVWIFGIHLKQSVNGKTEAVFYIGLSFLGMFFLYHQFWFYRYIAPLIYG